MTAMQRLVTFQLAAVPTVVWSAYAIAAVWADRHGQPAPMPPGPVQAQMVASLALPLAAVFPAWPLRRKLVLLIPAIYAGMLAVVVLAMLVTALVARLR